MSLVADITAQGLAFLASLFVFFIGLFALLIALLFIKDITQTQDAIRRNYPVIIRFRYLFNTLGKFFRQYFFAMDREEIPFNRAERQWVYKFARGKRNTNAALNDNKLRHMAAHPQVKMFEIEKVRAPNPSKAVFYLGQK